MIHGRQQLGQCEKSPSIFNVSRVLRLFAAWSWLDMQWKKALNPGSDPVVWLRYDKVKRQTAGIIHHWLARWRKKLRSEQPGPVFMQGRIACPERSGVAGMAWMGTLFLRPFYTDKQRVGRMIGMEDPADQCLGLTSPIPGRSGRPPGPCTE